MKFFAEALRVKFRPKEINVSASVTSTKLLGSVGKQTFFIKLFGRKGIKNPLKILKIDFAIP